MEMALALKVLAATPATAPLVAVLTAVATVKAAVSMEAVCA